MAFLPLAVLFAVATTVAARCGGPGTGMPVPDANGVLRLDGPTAIPDSAYWRCAELRRVVIGPNVRTLARQAFRESGVREVNLGDRLTTLSGYAHFAGCSDLAVIHGGGGLLGESEALLRAFCHDLAHPRGRDPLGALAERRQQRVHGHEAVAAQGEAELARAMPQRPAQQLRRLRVGPVLRAFGPLLRWHYK